MQDMWINRVLFRTQIDEPFDAEGIRKAMIESKKPAELRARLFDVMKNSYNKELDEENIKRIHEDALKKGKKLFHVLFGRANKYRGRYTLLQLPADN